MLGIKYLKTQYIYISFNYINNNINNFYTIFCIFTKYFFYFTFNKCELII